MALLDYLTNRRAEIEAQMKALRAELAEIKIAEDALTGGGRKLTGTIYPGGETATWDGKRLIRTGTIKDWIMRAMEAFPGGLDTEAAIEAIRKMGGPLVERSSMTPQLSRLKSAGLITHDGKRWRLPTQEEAAFDEALDGTIEQMAQNDETPGGETPSASVDDPFKGIVL